METFYGTGHLVTFGCDRFLANWKANSPASSSGSVHWSLRAESQDHNRENVPDAELVAVAKLDFRIRGSTSPSVDPGNPMKGINDDYVGDGPDLGAFEFGGRAWKAGASVRPFGD